MYPAKLLWCRNDFICRTELQHSPRGADISGREPFFPIGRPKDEDRPLSAARLVHARHDGMPFGIHRDHRHRVQLVLVRALQRAPNPCDTIRPPISQIDSMPDVSTGLAARCVNPLRRNQAAAPRTPRRPYAAIARGCRRARSLCSA